MFIIATPFPPSDWPSQKDGLSFELLSPVKPALSALPTTSSVAAVEDLCLVHVARALVSLIMPSVGVNAVAPPLVQLHPVLFVASCTVLPSCTIVASSVHFLHPIHLSLHAS